MKRRNYPDEVFQLADNNPYKVVAESPSEDAPRDARPLPITLATVAAAAAAAAAAVAAARRIKR